MTSANDDVQSYYDGLTRGLDVHVRLLQRAKGKGVFARRAFGPGDVVFRERPLVSSRFVDAQHDRVCCSHCLRAIFRRDADLPREYAAAFDLLVQTGFVVVVAGDGQPPIVPCPRNCVSSGVCARDV